MGLVSDLTPADRRALICEAALDLAAAGGNRAVTHGAVDRALDLPKGSTSYYFRTRRALLDAAVDHLADRSRRAFQSPADRPADEVVGRYLHELITGRRRDALARLALAPDTPAAAGTPSPLADVLFSPDAAVSLFTAIGSADPAADARDLLVLCEGFVVSHLFSGVTPSADEAAGAVRRRFGSLPPINRTHISGSSQRPGEPNGYRKR